MLSPLKTARAEGHFNLFFVEMIIVLLFFSIASAVILKAFAASDSLSRESGRLERMSFCAQSAAEIFSETGSVTETAAELFGTDAGNAAEEADEIRIPLDSRCMYAPADAAVYMTMTASDMGYGGRLLGMHTVFTDRNGEILYEVTSGAYMNGGDVSEQ